MREFRDKVAVVTGGASGIGRAIVEVFCKEGIRVVIGDIEQTALEKTVEDFRRRGAGVVGVRADVSRLADVEALRDRALAEFGAVHIVCNNAGIGTSGGVAETPIERWRWVLDVNLWGVIHGCHAFLPLFKECGEGYVVNTASIAGLSGHAMLGAYTASKFGVVGLSECLHHELMMARSAVRVSVFCPGLVQTNIRRSERNRPDYVPELVRGSRTMDAPDSDLDMMPGGMAADEAARILLEGIRNDRFYIFTHPEIVRQEVDSRRAWMLDGVPSA